MTRQGTWMRRAAAALAALAGSLLEPTARREWGRAMRAELEHIHGDYEALRWACGCAFAAITLRRTDMDLGTLRVSRFLLALEMALCFGPLTFGWFDIVFGMSGVAWLDMDSLDLYLGTTQGVAVLTTMMASAVLGLVGPLGLVVAARQIGFGRALRRGFLSLVLIAAPIGIGAVYLAANFVTGAEWSISRVGFYVLFVAGPLAGTVHLIYFGRRQPANTLSAA